jgi:hypothetical protein
MRFELSPFCQLVSFSVGGSASSYRTLIKCVGRARFKYSESNKSDSDIDHTGPYIPYLRVFTSSEDYTALFPTKVSAHIHNGHQTA